ncbi:uncharacterized protein TNIN_72901 [Trichonephila inaurata madagascariensis]|uniref:Cyclin-dependent kinase inhibitor domain-containing protein n=1 Tax=Trichonephila inaurata madagascariensis TaxID=2747483 RepID=A0A8X7CFS0_9ARAC|nr:uncharacterized protein TNIN_72901 [Trichonephila inaurata madagascariensis]
MTRQVETVFQPDIVTVNAMCCMWGFEPMTVMSARRNLFGAVSGAEPNVDDMLTHYMSEISEKAAKAWNFDFEREQPLTEGRFLWEKVCEEVPQKPNYKKKSQDTSICEKENKMLVKVCKDIKDEPKYKKSWRLVQTSIKNYARVQKRRTSKRLNPHPLRGSTRIRQFHRGS